LSRTENKNGFTLVEMILVMMVIGILAAMLLPRIVGAPAIARDANRVVALSSIAMALESYYSDHLEYPESNAVTLGDWGCVDSVNDLIVEKYLDTVPKDPLVTNNKLGCLAMFRYLAIEGDGGVYDSYLLAAGMEREQKANVDWSDIVGYDKDTDIQTAIDKIEEADAFASGDVFAYATYRR